LDHDKIKNRIHHLNASCHLVQEKTEGLNTVHETRNARCIYIYIYIVLCGYGTSSVVLMEGQRQRVSETKMTRQFGREIEVRKR